MASYEELQGVTQNAVLLNKLEMAVAEAARIIQEGEDTTDPPWSQDPTQIANRRIWARWAARNARTAAENMIRLILMKNKASTLAQIGAATDAAIQAQIENSVDLFADGSQAS